ncbi:adenosylcobinamide-GDP ribazoletransferase [Nocardioides speluncae]|uniref:adenosylcobinamide-GDP ribazoletransferase n=1 Tax=Nocardioides speluncae TaxID=2670337 RepID=UPI001F0C1084|nr:adenosylcobinamide-GDP ribazoletransferase [Nocardioides speluncae]
MNALRLLFGTLTILPVRPPTTVSRPVASWAMTLAPLAGGVLALLVAGPWALAMEYDGFGQPLLMGALAVSVLAVLTRAMHLDGLADTADGLGSGRRGDEALAIMRKSDIGPFGVVALVLSLLIQVAALAECGAHAPAALAVALVVSRTVLPVLCTAWFPAARADGLGSLVAGSVPPLRALVSLLVAAALVVGVLVVDDAPRLGFAALGLLAGVGLALHARRRFGGLTGDVYGACVEVTFTAALMVAAFAV